MQLLDEMFSVFTILVMSGKIYGKALCKFEISSWVRCYDSFWLLDLSHLIQCFISVATENTRKSSGFLIFSGDIEMEHSA